MSKNVPNPSLGFCSFCGFFVLNLTEQKLLFFRIYQMSTPVTWFMNVSIFRVVYHRIEITVSHVTHLIFRFRVPWPTNRIRPYMSHCEIAD